jgi:MarR family transcriptional regulator, 2-MHQ and catechol-resistance regulon repressor
LNSNDLAKGRTVPSHYKGCEQVERALSAYINFQRASDSIATRLEAQIQSSGLTMGQFAVLEALLHLGPMQQCVLGRKLLRSGGNVTIVIDNLAKRGWVRRQRQQDDHRQVVVHLTPKGRRLIERIFPEHAATIAREMSVLSPEEQEMLRVLCRKLGRGEDLCAERKIQMEVQSLPQGEQHGSDSTQ